jgi:hypothetical protein
MHVLLRIATQFFFFAFYKNIAAAVPQARGGRKWKSPSNDVSAWGAVEAA